VRGRFSVGSVLAILLGVAFLVYWIAVPPVQRRTMYRIWFRPMSRRAPSATGTPPGSTIVRGTSEQVVRARLGEPERVEAVAPGPPTAGPTIRFLYYRLGKSREGRSTIYLRVGLDRRGRVTETRPVLP